MKKTCLRHIPLVHCFDSNYVIPAAIAFRSMLGKAAKNNFYDIFVLHSDLSNSDMAGLRKIVDQYDNASIEFHLIDKMCDRLFFALDNAGRRHYSKEMFAKLLVPHILEHYERCIVLDVDVVWEGDVSEYFEKLDGCDDFYLAGARIIRCGWTDSFKEENMATFSHGERAKIEKGINAGYIIMNLAAMRRDGVVEKLIAFAKDNIKRLRNPEQDTFNIVCADKIKLMPPRMMVCTYLYDKTTDAEKKLNADLIANPIQIHYASQVKPWNTPSSVKSELWYRWLMETPYFHEFMARFDPPKEKRKYWLKALGMPIVRVKEKPMVKESLSLFGILPLKRKD